MFFYWTFIAIYRHFDGKQIVSRENEMAWWSICIQSMNSSYKWLRICDILFLTEVTFYWWYRHRLGRSYILWIIKFKFLHTYIFGLPLSTYWFQCSCNWINLFHHNLIHALHLKKSGNSVVCMAGSIIPACILHSVYDSCAFYRANQRLNNLEILPLPHPLGHVRILDLMAQKVSCSRVEMEHQDLKSLDWTVLKVNSYK